MNVFKDTIKIIYWNKERIDVESKMQCFPGKKNKNKTDADSWTPSHFGLN